MAYLFLILALICLTVKGYCGKRTSNDIRRAGDPLLFNLMRMIFCLLIGLGVVFVEQAGEQLAIEGGMLWITLAAGAANAAFLVGWLLAIQRTPLVTVDVSLTIGSILPAVLCAILFAEAISPWKMAGFALILAATAVLAGYSKDTGKKTGLAGMILVVVAALGDGISAFCQQLYKQFYTEAGTRTHGVFYAKSIYHFYTYVFAVLLLLLCFVGFALWQYAQLRRSGAQAETLQKTVGDGAHPQRRKWEYVKGLFASCKHPMPYIIIMAVCLFASNYFQTVATNDYGMDSQVLYPVIKGGCLITVNITAMLFFGEKPTWRSILGSGVALGGIVMMSIL